MHITDVSNRYIFENNYITYIPSRFHQTGHPEANLATPLENINRNRSQRTHQNVTVSLGVLIFAFFGTQNGAMSTDKKPASNNRVSL